MPNFQLICGAVFAATVGWLSAEEVLTSRDAWDMSHRPQATFEHQAMVLEEDWLFQAGQRPTVRRSIREIEKARTLAERLGAREGSLDLSSELGELDLLQRQLQDLADNGADSPATRLYLAVRRVKRRIVLANPAIDFSQVLFIDQPYPRFPEGKSWPYDRKGGNVCRHGNSHRNGMMATAGGKLVLLDGLGGGRPVELGPDIPGSYWRPDLSFDGRNVLFCFKPDNEKAFHLYELEIDGGAVRQLTFGDYDDLDPIYLPDGHIMFVTTRCHTYVRCMPHANSYVLARCDADGQDVYIVSRSNECDWLPALLNDGRVIYSRWEYTDKPLWRIQSLWTVNPDGTNTAVMWGNQSVWPDHLAEPRPIPGSHRVMFTAVGHHDWFAGSVGIIDPRRGREFPDGLTKVTADVPWPEVGNGPAEAVESPEYEPPGPYDAYKTPFPISEETFLVSARRNNDDRFRLYLMDVRGNLELIHEGDSNVWHAVPVRPRRRPSPQLDRVSWPGSGTRRGRAQPGTLYSPNVFEGVPEPLRQKTRYLRVFQQDHTTYSTGGQTFRWAGPGVSIVQEDGVKRILGTVPVNADGSVHFEAPAGKMLYFQLLDEHHRALQTMRSFTGVMPGEVRGCTGCHELHAGAPPNRQAVALRSPPARLTPPPWGNESIGYERFVQPVLDRYCGDCHQGEGEGRESLDLTLRPGYRFMKEPYLMLVGPAIWKNPKLPDLRLPDPAAAGFGLAGIFPIETFDAEAIVEPFKWYNSPRVRPEAYAGKYATLRPMTALSYRSPLIALAMGGDHYDVKMDPVSLRRLIAWVDAMGPYRGEEEIRAMPDPDFPGIEQFPIRPVTKTAPAISRP